MTGTFNRIQIDRFNLIFKIHNQLRETNHQVRQLTDIDRLSPANRLAVKEDLAALEREFNLHRERGRIPDEVDIAARLAELEAVRT